MSRLFDRRTFLKAAGAPFLLALAPRAMAETLAVDALFATAFQKRDGSCGVAVRTEAGKTIHSVALPDRGHDVTFDPVSRRSVVFARQPGTFAVVFDHKGAVAPVTLTSVEGRHFYGHGVFSPDGKLLYATENDYDNAVGMIGVYDATNDFARIGEFATHGVGPHEVLLCPDGKTLAIANGGIETHPDFGRAKLNIPTMKPSLVFVDRDSGALLEKHELPPELHQLSIRHMDFDETGALWFGCQHEGPEAERPALIGRAKQGDAFGLIDLPAQVLGGLRNYIGSVAANRHAGQVAFTSPQGNSWLVIDAKTQKLISAADLTEVCGVAPDEAGFLVSTGAGLWAPVDSAPVSDPQFVWDNHVFRFPA